MKLLFLALVMGICLSALAQVVPRSAVPPDGKSNRSTPLPSKAGMFGIGDVDEPTMGTTRSALPVSSNEKLAEKTSPGSPSNEELGKLIRDQTHAINLLFIELNSLKGRIDEIEAGRH